MGRVVFPVGTVAELVGKVRETSTEGKHLTDKMSFMFWVRTILIYFKLRIVEMLLI